MSIVGGSCLRSSPARFPVTRSPGAPYRSHPLSKIMHMKKIYLLLVVGIGSGCMQAQMLPHLDEALTLRSLSEEGDQQRKDVSAVNAAFDKLLAAVESGDIKKYRTQGDVMNAFGPPITVKDIVIDGKTLKVCLYRYAIQKEAKKRVYLYFNTKGHLVRWESL